MRSHALLSLPTLMLLAGCAVDEFAAPPEPTDPTAPAPDAAPTAPAPDGGPSVDAATGPTFCQTQSEDDAGRSVFACADFDRGAGGDPGWQLIDEGMGTIAIDGLGSPSPPNHLHAKLPTLGSSGSGTKRIEVALPLPSGATIDLDMKASSLPLASNQTVTYLSVTPNGSENALGAFRIVRSGATWRLTTTGGNPSIKDLPALSVVESAWHHLRIVFQREPMTYQLSLDGKVVVTATGFAIPDPTKIAFRVGAWNDVMQPAQASDEVLYDNVVVSKM